MQILTITLQLPKTFYLAGKINGTTINQDPPTQQHQTLMMKTCKIQDKTLKKK